MNRLFTLAFFLLAFNSFSQTIIIDSIPPQGFLLSKGWKFHAGDNAAWAKPDFNDTGWEFINPVLDVHHSLPQIPKSGICWLRIHLSLDSGVLRKHLALLIQQSVASEIYLNNVLISKLGVLDSDPAKVIAFDPLSDPVLLPSLNSSEQVLAVRLAVQPGARYTTLFLNSLNSLFTARLQETTKAYAGKSKAESVLRVYNGFMVGLLLLLLLIHSAYYYFYPDQSANLYFSLYAGCFLINNIAVLLFDNHNVAQRFYAQNFLFLIVIATNLFLLTAIYKLLEQKRDWMYWSLYIMLIPAVCINILQYSWGWHIGADLMTLLINIIIAKLTLEAVMRKKKGAWLLAGGAMCCLLFFLLFVIVSNVWPEIKMVSNILFLLTDLSIPITTSLYLGLDFGFVSVALKQKLNEVNALSLKSLQQEQEKQRILAAQNEILESQVEKRTAELSLSLDNLKATQKQLIQTEKMASLGELTAGIAHEIQNPLNFVNNFSEVNKELTVELEEELRNGNFGGAMTIAKDIRDNEEKIFQHGKRADAIVKNMMQHSHTISGVMEHTDLNALTGEYLRLAYHGFRARDKNFNASLLTNFDNTIGKVNVVPQDIGRVLLNLLNNAFYAVADKKKTHPDYSPEISVSTKKENGIVKINVKDNGYGIPKQVLDKIFQPFFTTKPSGEGTGLGLSLSYDIIKAHQGEIKINNHVGEGVEFIISLSVSQDERIFIAPGNQY